MNFSGDPYQKNEVYGGVECTGGIVRERMSVCVVLREKEVERKRKEKKNKKCVAGQREKRDILN